MSKQAIASKHAPGAIGPYSQAIRAGWTVYLSGQIGLDPATGNLVDGLEAQTPTTVAPSVAPGAAPSVAPTPGPPATSAPTSAPGPRPSSDRYELLIACPDIADCWVYVVRQGDNLVSIAKYFGVPLATIEERNAWTRTTQLVAGQELILPTPAR